MSLIDAVKQLFGAPPRLSTLEQAIFAAVGGSLRPKEAQLWSAQLALINRIHRSPDAKEVNVWCMRGGNPRFPPEVCYVETEVFKFAVVDVTAVATGVSLRARVWCAEGHVFSIEYKRSFKDFEANAGTDWQVRCHVEHHPGQA